MVGQVNLQMVLNAVDKASPALEVVAKAMGKIINVGGQEMTFGQQLQQVGHKARNAATELGALALKLGAIGGVTALAFKKGFLDIGRENERLKTILATLEGSQQGAQKSFDWIEKFAVQTPYEITEVTEAFVKLRNYGIDPTKGSLLTLGNTAAGMGKPLMAAIEMMADASNSDNERLRDFGITTITKGERVAFSYFNRQGQAMVKVINKNRTEVVKALTDIFSDKYAGSMEALSRTFNGILSNLKDAWTNFAVAVMDSGVMDVLKTELGALKDWLTALTANEAVVKQVADIIKQKILEIKAVLTVVWPVVVQIATAANAVAQALGGWGNVINIALILISLNAIGAIVALVFSLLAPLLTIAGIIATAAAVVGGLFFFLTAISAGLSPIAVALAMIGGTLMNLLASFASIGRMVVLVATWVGRVLMLVLRFAGPIGLTITAVVTLVSLGALLYTKWKPFKDLIDTIAKALVGIGQAGLGGLQAMGSKLGFRADGGPVSAGSPYIVGERGPELMVPRTNGAVLPNLALAGLGLGGGGGHQTLHIKVDIDNRTVSLVANKTKGQPLPTKLDMGFLRA